LSARQGRILLANQRVEDLFGYTRAEVLGKSIDVLVPVRFRGTHGGHRHSFFNAPRNREMGAGRELWGLRKDGTEFAVEISLSPLETADGPVALAAMRDVTERKKAETRFRALLDSAPDAMVIVNSDGFIELANAQSEKIFGYPRFELVGQSVEILVPDSVRGTHGEHLQGYFRNPRARAMGAGLDLMALRKDGTQFPVEISLSPLDGPDGTSVTAAIRDVTERKLAARQLAEKIA
jgi:PAS domain S-box-containing protein